MRPIPQCKREIIVAAKKRGEKAATIAQWVGVTVDSVYNILRLYDRTKSLSPKPFPGREKGDIAVIDNLSAHKVKGALAPIYKRGAHVLFLPPYSPDFNPIELSWAKMKAVLKKLNPRTYDELVALLQIALNCFTNTDINN